MDKLRFSNTWFNNNKKAWDGLIATRQPRKILEIGSYEGASACYLINTLANMADIELHCVDKFFGNSAKLKNNLYEEIKRSFFKVNLVLSNDDSYIYLSKLISEGKQEYFDLIYIDGSHEPADVLIDASLSFKLCKIGGLIIFDDYFWSNPKIPSRDLLESPKIAVDAFLSANFRKVKLLEEPLRQIYLEKISG